VKTWQQKSNRSDDALIFKTENTENPEQALRRRLSRFFASKWHVQSHDFRTSWSTECFNKKKDLSIVSKYLNHKKLSTTEAYIKINTTENLNEAAKIMMI
jgi:site-specific recombinase XerD